MHQGGRAAKGSADNCSRRKSKQSSCRGWRRASTAKAGKGFQGLRGKWKTLILSGLILCSCAEGQKSLLSVDQRKESHISKGPAVWAGVKQVSESKSRSHQRSSMSMDASKSIFLSQLAQDREVKASVLLLASSCVPPPAHASTRETL